MGSCNEYLLRVWPDGSVDALLEGKPLYAAIRGFDGIQRAVDEGTRGYADVCDAARRLGDAALSLDGAVRAFGVKMWLCH